jgi:DNA modification methylase
MKTQHKIFFANSSHIDDVGTNSIDLVVTSPPYPMIVMWDDVFSSQDKEIKRALDADNGPLAFELMHQVLDPVLTEVYRVVKNGGFLCINIGDATRTLGGNFVLYPNHMRILHRLLSLGFTALPCILWRKQTNAPNKFMGSGTLPAGAYVTLEHEYILILRKGSKRIFANDEDKETRRKSSIFWEERNNWYSDVWFDVKGTLQTLNDKQTRLRSAAYPFEMVYRLVNMYSVKGDFVLDPFLGTGTTTAACIASGRNSIGYELDPTLEEIIHAVLKDIDRLANQHILNRINNHLSFVKLRLTENKPIKHKNKYYGFPVVTSQEKELLLNEVIEVLKRHTAFEAIYSDTPHRCLVPQDPFPIESDDLSKFKWLERAVSYEMKSVCKRGDQLTLF